MVKPALDISKLSARLILFALLLSACGSAPRPAKAASTASVFDTYSETEAEQTLEAVLHELDLLEAAIYALRGTEGDPIAACAAKNPELISRKRAFYLAIGKPLQADKAMEMKYYDLLQERKSDDLLPLVYLRKYYHEQLLQCVLDALNKKAGETQPERAVMILTAHQFDGEIQHGLVLVDVMTHWCVPCKKMAPDLEKLALRYKGKLKVGRLDADRNMPLAQRFGVQRFPTLLLLSEGKEIKRLERAVSFEELQNWIQSGLQDAGDEAAE